MPEILLDATDHTELQSTGDRIGQMLATFFTECPEEFEEQLLYELAIAIDADLVRWFHSCVDASVLGFLQRNSSKELGELINFDGYRWTSVRVLLLQAVNKALSQLRTVAEDITLRVAPDSMFGRDVALIDASISTFAAEGRLHAALKERLPPCDTIR